MGRGPINSEIGRYSRKGKRWQEVRNKPFTMLDRLLFPPPRSARRSALGTPPAVSSGILIVLTERTSERWGGRSANSQPHFANYTDHS
jgi:hypothetical protein